MKKMSITEFRARCFEVMRILNTTRKPTVITKNGHAIAKLISANPARRDFMGSLRGIFEIAGDIESPVEPIEVWNALRGATSTV